VSSGILRVPPSIDLSKLPVAALEHETIAVRPRHLDFRGAPINEARAFDVSESPTSTSDISEMEQYRV